MIEMEPKKSDGMKFTMKTEEIKAQEIVKLYNSFE